MFSPGCWHFTSVDLAENSLVLLSVAFLNLCLFLCNRIPFLNTKGCTEHVQIHSVTPVPTCGPIYFITCFSLANGIKMEPGGLLLFTRVYSRVQALPTGTHARPAHTDTCVAPRAHVVLWNLLFFLIFRGIFRRLGSAVSLLAEPFHLLFTCPFFSVLPARLPQTLLQPAEINPFSRLGQGCFSLCVLTACLSSASASSRELPLCVRMRWGAGPDERELPRKPQEQDAYRNEARYDNFIFLV